MNQGPFSQNKSHERDGSSKDFKVLIPRNRENESFWRSVRKTGKIGFLNIKSGPNDLMFSFER